MSLPISPKTRCLFQILNKVLAFFKIQDAILLKSTQIFNLHSPHCILEMFNKSRLTFSPVYLWRAPDIAANGCNGIRGVATQAELKQLYEYPLSA